MSTIYYLSDGYLAGMGIWLLVLTVVPIVAIKWRRGRRLAGKSPVRAHATLMLWLLLLLLTLPELYCALLYDTTDSFGLTNVSRRWYEMHVAPNAAGFRDDQPLSPELPPGTRHVCFVGDSFTFGHGVPDVADRFSDRIALELEAARPGAFHVSNAGLPGLDVRQLVDKLLPDLIRRAGPIDVLVYTFVLNDIEYFDERTARHYQAVSAMQPEFFLFRDSYFYNLLYYRWQQLRRPAVGDYYSYLAGSYEGRPWQRLTRKLDELRDLCDDRQIELRVAIFPFLHNLGPGYPFDEAHRRLNAYFEDKGIACLDLKPALAGHVGEGLTVNRFDAHPSKRAHKLAADAIRTQLLDDLFAGPADE